MKKGIRCCLAAGAVTLSVCGCGKESTEQNVHKLEHDIEDAVSMIDEAEWDCAWLQTQDTISRSSAEALAAHLDSLIDGTGTEAVCSQMDGKDWEDDSIKTLTLLHDSIQPTIYHEGISVVSAEEECSCEILDGADECRQHLSTLTIRKSYSGDDPKLKDWYLEYVFRQTEHEGEWEFLAYNGTYNTDVQLELRESFYDAAYDLPELLPK